MFTNPILPGGFPDPCMCRVGDDFYLVNSSFEYFPGLPIHHSRDLLNWEWVGYGLHREEQVNGMDGGVNLMDVASQDGIQAPSLRYHERTFYLIATCVYRRQKHEGEKEDPPGTCTNFIITATDIRGPWSQPHVLDGAPGIDPDIIFDDGKVWYLGTHEPHETPNFAGEGEIWLQEIDLSGWRLIGKRHYLWRGACYGGVFVEGPHVYSHEGRYYLLVAEGGTGVNHAVMMASSDEIIGPYYPNERNPLLTSRNLSYNNWVHSTGHADLFQLQDGRWYLVCLGIRGDAGENLDRRSNMGRETFLVPVVWEREPMEWSPLGPPMRHLWPVAAPESGRVERQGPVPFKGTEQGPPHRFRDDFLDEGLNLEWNFRRFPKPGTYSLSARRSFLRLFAQPEIIKERVSCSLMGVRQRESDFEYRARMEMPETVSAGMEAGISLFQKDNNYVNCVVVRRLDAWFLRLAIAEPDKEVRCEHEIELKTYSGHILFEVLALGQSYVFRYSLAGNSNFEQFATTESGMIISKGYTGAYLGVYCSSVGLPASTTNFVDFDWIEHVALPRP